MQDTFFFKYFKNPLQHYYFILCLKAKMHIMALPEVVQCRVMHWLLFTKPLRRYCVWICNQPLIEELQCDDSSEGIHYCEDTNLRYKRVAGPLYGQPTPNGTISLCTRDIDSEHGEPNRPWSIYKLNTTTIGSDVQYCGPNNDNVTIGNVCRTCICSDARFGSLTAVCKEFASATRTWPSVELTVCDTDLSLSSGIALVRNDLYNGSYFMIVLPCDTCPGTFYTQSQLGTDDDTDGDYTDTSSGSTDDSTDGGNMSENDDEFVSDENSDNEDGTIDGEDETGNQEDGGDDEDGEDNEHGEEG